MAKKRKYAGRTDDEWKDFGLNFGKHVDKGSRHFCEEMDGLGRKFGNFVEYKEKECRGWWLTTFGMIGPLIGSVLGILCLAICVWVLQLVNSGVHSTFISVLTKFLLVNLPWFFLALLFFGYTHYVSKRWQRIHWILSPLIAAVGAVIAIWFLILILNVVNVFVENAVILNVSTFLYENIMEIFSLVIVIGYAIKILRISRKKWGGK